MSKIVQRRGPEVSQSLSLHCCQGVRIRRKTYRRITVQIIGNSLSVSRWIGNLPNLPARVLSELVGCAHQDALSVWDPRNVTDALNFLLTKEGECTGLRRYSRNRH